MKLICKNCKNDQRFMASATTELQVLVDGDGRVVDPRASDQILDDLKGIRPWKCNSCGGTDIMDTEDSNVSGSR